jgi:hypothetical protein
MGTSPILPHVHSVEPFNSPMKLGPVSVAIKATPHLLVVGVDSQEERSLL